MTDVSTPWSRGNVDFSAAGTDHRRRVAEAARQRLAVLDQAAHYTSTTYAAEPRVVDRGHGGDFGYGAGSRQMDVVDRPLGSRVPSHRAVRDSPLRAPQGTAGSRVRAAAGAGSYASMYDERLAADAMAHPGVSWDRPETETRRWAGEVETRLDEVSAFLKRAALDDAAVVGWEDARGPAISSSRDTKTEPSEETWSPRVPQTYARAENVRDVDDGHGGAWRRTEAFAQDADDFSQGSGQLRVRNPLNATRRASDRSPLNDRPGWNGELYVPEELRGEEADPLGGDDKRGARRASRGVTAKIGADPESSFLDSGETFAFETPSSRDARRDDDAEMARGGGAYDAKKKTSTEGTPFRRASERSESVRPAARSTASKLAALKDRRAAQRENPSRGDASTSRRVVRFDEDTRRPTRTRNQTRDEKHLTGGSDAPSPETAPEEKRNAALVSRRETSDALGETWGEFGTTLRPQPRTTRTGLTLASDRRKTQTRTNDRVAAESRADPETEDAFGGYTPRREQSTTFSRRPSLSASPARVAGGIGHLTTELPVDMRGMSVPEGADVGPSALSPCDTCGRKFNARALEIHSKSCAKVFAAKRKTFDVAKQRATGTDLERFKRMGGGGDAFRNDDDDSYGGGGRGGFKTPKRRETRKTPAAARRGSSTSRTETGSSARPVPKWKKESERFRAGLRAGRTGQSFDAGHDEDLVPCPHCGRSFNEQAATRHIPQCTNIRAKPSRLVRGGGRGAHVAAKSGFGGMGGDYSRTRAF
jgi:hypothetical protein